MRNTARFTRFLAPVVGACVVVGVLGAAASPASAASATPNTPSDARLDPDVVTELAEHGPVDVIVSFNGERTGRGDRRHHDAVKHRLRDRKQAALADTEVQSVSKYNELPVEMVRVRNSRQLQRLLAKPAVQGISLPNSYAPLAGQSDPTALALVRQPAAATAGYKGAGTFVAVIDTGADYTQPAFGSCSAPYAPTSCRIFFAHDYAPDDHVADDDGHGTNVAGIVANVAPATRIFSLDVFAEDAQGRFQADDADILQALNDVAYWVRSGYNIRAVNMSLGDETRSTGACQTTYRTTLAELVALGVVPVVAAGNSGYLDGTFENGVSSPACDPSALAVGAVYAQDAFALGWGGGPREDGRDDSCFDWSGEPDQPTCFSQSGPNLGLWAPGSPVDAAGLQKNGTSQAAPHVAGAVAVLAAARPAATAANIRTALTTTGPPITDVRAPHNPAKRRLDVSAAVNAVLAQAPQNPAPTVSAPAEALVTNGRLSATVPYKVSWSASDANGINAFDAQYRVNGGAWAAVAVTAGTSGALNFNATPGTKYEVRVRARDGLGAWSAYVQGRPFTARLRQETDTSVRYGGTWARKAWAPAYGGYMTVSAQRGADASITATGTGIAWVATRAANRGVATVYVDGVAKANIDLGTSTTLAQSVAYTVRFSSAGTHTVQVVVAGTSGRPSVDVDGFVVTT